MTDTTRLRELLAQFDSPHAADALRALDTIDALGYGATNAMKHTTRPKLQPEETYVDPETGAVVMPEGTPMDVVPYFTQETHEGPRETCPICAP